MTVRSRGPRNGVRGQVECRVYSERACRFRRQFLSTRQPLVQASSSLKGARVQSLQGLLSHDCQREVSQSDSEELF